jgi:putative membrane protein
MIANQTNSRIVLSSVATLVAGMVVLACQPACAVAQMAGNTAGSGISGTKAGPNVSLFDRSFVLSILESDTIEEQIGQLAEQKSQSDDVKQFAQQMVALREIMDDQYKPIAVDLGLRPPKDPSKKYKQMIARLQTLSGDQFDQEYIKAVVEDHERAAKVCKTEADSTQDHGLEKTAKDDAVSFQQHLLTIQQIAQAHNVPVDAPKK